MPVNYRLEAVWILSASSITTPLNEWINHGYTRDGLVSKRVDNTASGRADQSGMTPLASSVFINASAQGGWDTKLINFQVDEILKAIPTGVKISNSAKEAIGFGSPTSRLTPRAWAIVPVANYVEGSGSWADADNIEFIEEGFLEITGPVPFKLAEGEDTLEGYEVIVRVLDGGSVNTGGVELYRILYSLELTVGTQPISAAYNPDGTKIAVANRISNSIMIVDVATATLDDTITVGTKPISVSYNPDGTKIAVANFDSNNIMIVDVATATLDDTITVGTQPISVSYNPDGTKIAVANLDSNNIMIVDVNSATVDDTITVGTKPYSAAYNPDGTKIAVANRDSNNIMIVDVNSATLDDTITVGTSPRSVAYNHDGTKIAVANYTSNNIQEITGV